ncbi:MAG: hypothetical protein WDZ53_10140 [Balneolales bacterium]
MRSKNNTGSLWFLMRVALVILIIFSITRFIKADSPMEAEAGQNYIMTVTGPINPDEMRTTLIHEHVIVDWNGADSTGYHRWNQKEVIERALPFINEAREKGVSTIIECTPSYLGRDPFILKELSNQTGVQILTNTGYYGAVDNTFIPEHAHRETAKEIAYRWVDEFENGIDGSDVRPGYMKISVAANQPLSMLHRKIVQAAAITHLETGLAIASHTNGDEPALEQVQLLKDEGIFPSAWIWAHAQSGTLEGNIKVAEEGAWISLDGVNYNESHEPGEDGTIEWYINRILAMKNSGLLDKVLISHDAGWYAVGEKNGGTFRGYTDIFDHLIPKLQNNGFTEEDIRQLLVINPSQAYAIQVRMK